MDLPDLLADVRKMDTEKLATTLAEREAEVKILRTLLVAARRRERSERPKRGRPRAKPAHAETEAEPVG